MTVAASLGRTFTFDELARTLGRPASDLLAPVDGAPRGEPARRARREPRLLARHHSRGRPRERAGHRPPRARPPGRRRPARSRRPAGRGRRANSPPAPRSATRWRSRRSSMPQRRWSRPTRAPLRSSASERSRSRRSTIRSAGRSSGTTAIALHIAGNSEQAIAFADRALRETLPALQEAEVRLSIAGMFAISPEIRIGAGRLALNLPDLPETLRARHLACLFHNLVTAGRLDEARATARRDARGGRIRRRRSCVVHAPGRRERARVHRRPLSAHRSS